MRQEPLFIELITRFHGLFETKRYPRFRGFVSNTQNFQRGVFVTYSIKYMKESGEAFITIITA